MVVILFLILGLGSCVEVWHPKDIEPPLFHCDLCDLNTDFRQIIEHIKGAKHNYQFFVSIVVLSPEKKINHFLTSGLVHPYHLNESISSFRGL